MSVPSRLGRLRRRGASLPHELGRALHDSLGIRYEPDALISTIDDIEIKRIAVETRWQVVCDTFAVGPRNLIGKSVLLIDDIMTSGATVAECAYHLRTAGVKAVFAYTLGRTADIALRQPVMLVRRPKSTRSVSLIHHASSKAGREISIRPLETSSVPIGSTSRSSTTSRARVG